MFSRRRLLSAGLICLATFVATQPLFAESPIVGTQKNGASGIAWLYESPLTVFEEITPIDGGLYQYTYSFLNTDPDNIWLFAVFTTFEVQFPMTPFSDFPLWWAWDGSQESANPAYDATVLDPNITTSGLTWFGSGPDYPYDDNPIPTGVFVEGFSFIGTELDPNPKYYFYETLESGHASDTGFVAAVGLTQNGVVGTQESTWGGVKSLYR